MPIAKVREYVDLVRRGDVSTPERLALLLTHRESVIAQLDEMTKSLAAIDFKIATYKKGSK
jgi:DNA-binding transcriptional MerR regulator